MKQAETTGNDMAGQTASTPRQLVRDATRLGFDAPVPPGGYVWWYVDALSDDGRFGLTIIAFIGSVFSPYYAWSGRQAPENHCAINVALYGPRGRWAMTERTAATLTRDGAALSIGPSAVSWDGSALTIDIDEIGAPLPRRIRGRVRVMPSATTTTGFELDPDGRHVWWPIAPVSHVEVALDHPSLDWSGHGYLDTNSGAEPLEDGFRRWDWSRGDTGTGATVLYDATLPDGAKRSLALGFDRDGAFDEFEPPDRVRLPGTLWGIGRSTRSDTGTKAKVVRTLEDTPFYARSLVSARLAGADVTAFHESLDLRRFSRNWVRVLLPFRMPRRSL